MQFADIILPLHLPKPLTYGIPIAMQSELQVGMRVEVNMGKNKLYAGIILRLHNDKPDGYAVKPIKSVIDHTPIVNQQQLSFWEWISDYYLCSINDVLQVAVPAHFKLMSDSLLIWTGDYDVPPEGLNDDAYILAEALHIRQNLTIGEVHQLLEGRKISQSINEILDLGIAAVSEVLEEKYRTKKERTVYLQDTFLQNEEKLQAVFKELERAPKQLQLLIQYFQLDLQKKGVPAKLLLEKANATSATLKSLEDKSILISRMIDIERIEAFENDAIKPVVLSDSQMLSKKLLYDNWEKFDVNLLHGVTGSGKTLIYIDLIKEAIVKGKQALFLLPEIALTTHIVSRLRAYFGKELGVYHSKFSNNERVEIWKKVKNRSYNVIVGPRSALWLPFEDLGLIVVDEEHDTSFKQYDPVPRYHARDAAIFLAKLFHAKVLLGTATPSLESSYNVHQKKYGYVALKERYNGVNMPEIITANARNVQASLSEVLTLDLLSAMQDAFTAGKQVILFQNKRGYAPFLICGSCGFVPRCTNCDVSLTYHKHSDKLHCHYCGIKRNVIKQCPSCGNEHIATKNFGTEKIEEEIQRIFPQRKVARMDVDSMRSAGRQAATINDFEAGKIDVLVGTQMVVKGLDFGNVSLVGILSADSLLNFPDFRVNERAFQLMEQVSGRAGRVDGKGKVIIQTLKADHQIIQDVIAHDYRQMYASEMEMRQYFSYPPFVRLIKITIKHKDNNKVIEAANGLSKHIALIEGVMVTGPTAPVIPKVRNLFIQEILLKLPKDNHFIKFVKDQLKIFIQETNKIKGNSNMIIYADVDPL